MPLKIDVMICTPGKASAVKTALRGLSPFPDTGMALSGVVGKSHRKGTGGEWDSVGPVRVHSQLKVLLSSMEGIEVVNDVRDILGTVPQLNRLVLLGCPSISSENIRDLLDAEHQLLYHLEALIHPFLLGILQDASDTWPYRNAFSYIGLHSGYLELLFSRLPLSFKL